MKHKTNDATMLAGEASRLLGISTRTLSLWADKGKVRVRRMSGGWRLYSVSDIVRMGKELKRRHGVYAVFK